MARERTDGRDWVVVPGIRNPSTVACIRSLGPLGVNTLVVSPRAETPARYSSYCDEFVLVPDPSEDLIAYKEALLDVVAREGVRTVVPVREADIYVLARYRDEFERYVSLVTPSLDALQHVQDRLRLVEAAESAGVPVPGTQLLSDVDDWTRRLLIKARYTLLASSYVDSVPPATAGVVKTIEHPIPGREPDTASLMEAMCHEPIVQEYVPHDNEYMVAALYDHGEPLAVFQHRQIRGKRYVGAGGVYRKSVDIPELESVACDLLEHLDWHGLACLEYLEDAETGEFTLAEINPRMWQSLAATVRMGADFPSFYWRQAAGQTDAIDPTYRVGVGCHWLKGELHHLLSLFRFESPHVDRPGALSTLWDIVSSCVTQPRFDYLTLDDPGPFVADWWELLEHLPLMTGVGPPGGRPLTSVPPRRPDDNQPGKVPLESENREGFGQ